MSNNMIMLIKLLYNENIWKEQSIDLQDKHQP